MLYTRQRLSQYNRGFDIAISVNQEGLFANFKTKDSAREYRGKPVHSRGDPGREMRIGRGGFDRIEGIYCLLWVPATSIRVAKLLKVAFYLLDGSGRSGSLESESVTVSADLKPDLGF